MVFLATPVAQAVEADAITPGVVGFAVTFALALTCWLLFRSMTRHVRKVNQRGAQADPGASDDPPEAGPPSSARSS